LAAWKVLPWFWMSSWKRLSLMASWMRTCTNVMSVYTTYICMYSSDFRVAPCHATSRKIRSNPVHMCVACHAMSCDMVRHKNHYSCEQTLR
jgi:hypothetical protein